MFNKFTIADKLLFLAAFSSLIFSEILYFKGEKADATFMGMWWRIILPCSLQAVGTAIGT
jgi:hypothetical protein